MWYHINVMDSASNLSNVVESIVIAHHNRLIREGIAKILEEANFHVVGQADTGRNLLQLVAQHHPDIVVVDWEVSEVDSDIIHNLTEGSPQMAIVILTRPQSAKSLLPAMQAGARGYLSVNLSPQEFVQALRMLSKGDVIVSQEMANGIKEELAACQTLETMDNLSCREREVIKLVGHGATNQEIAEDLFVSGHTVKAHLRNILNKLNLRNRQQVAVYAAQKGMVTDIESQDPFEPAP